MNRLTFLKRLLGGVAAAPVLAKALAEEKAPLPLPSFPAYNGFTTGVSSYPVCTGNLVSINGVSYDVTSYSVPARTDLDL